MVPPARGRCEQSCRIAIVSTRSPAIADARRARYRNSDAPTHAVSLCGVDSLAVHTAAMWSGTMNEAQMKAAGIPPNFVRFAVGIEHIDDLTDDVDRALRA